MGCAHTWPRTPPTLHPPLPRPSVDAGDKVLLLADGSALFTKAIGAELDLTDKGLGVRSRRYACLVDDGVVKVLNLEEGGAFTVSSADEILAAL